MLISTIYKSGWRGRLPVPVVVTTNYLTYFDAVKITIPRFGRHDDFELTLFPGTTIITVILGSNVNAFILTSGRLLNEQIWFVIPVLHLRCQFFWISLRAIFINYLNGKWISLSWMFACMCKWFWMVSIRIVIKRLWQICTDDWLFPTCFIFMFKYDSEM